MLAPDAVDPDQQEPKVADIQQQDEFSYHVSISGGLPQDSKQPSSSQPVRPWSAGSRPSSALAATRPRPTSAVRINNVATDVLQANGTESVQGAVVVNDRPASPGLWTQSAPRARPQSSKGRSRPKSAASQPQQEQQQPTSYQQQRLSNTMQQLQAQQDAHNSITQLQIPRLNLINLKSAHKMRSASFPQQGLLQAPEHKVPEVITDLVTAVNSQHDDREGLKGAGVWSASDTAAAAAVGAAVPASSPSKRQASVITIGVSPRAIDSSTALSDAGNSHTTVDTSTTEFEATLHDSSLQQWQLNVLGTIEEEDSVLRTQRQQQADNQQIPRCASPVNLAADVSFDNCSYANSGHNSPPSPYNKHKQRPHSSSSNSSRRRQQVSENTAGLLDLDSTNHRSSGSGLLRHEQRQQILQDAQFSSSEEFQQQQQQEEEGECRNASYEASAADHSFYGALVTSNHKAKSRPWSAAATSAARKLYGAQTSQLAGPAQQQQKQKQRRCGSAHPHYGIDTRLMTRSAGVFCPSVSLAASRGAGFHVPTTRGNSSRSRSTLPPHHSSSRSAAARSAAAAVSLNSSLSASRCCSRQQQQLPDQQQSGSGSSHRYSDLNDSVDLDLAGGDLAGSRGTLDDHNADDAYLEQQQQEQEQLLVNEVSLHSSDNASKAAAAAAAAEQRDEVLQQQQQQRIRSVVSQMATGRDSPTAAGQTSYRLPASHPVSAAAVVAAKQRSSHQARLATAKGARNPDARPRSDHSTARRGGLGGGVGGGAAAAAAAVGKGSGVRGVKTDIGQIVISSSRRGSSRWH